jgi:ferrous iron transport protein A
MRLDDAALDGPARLRMREIGLRPGAVVRVVQCAGFGGRVVACGHQRFALDAATAAALRGTRLTAA